MSVPTHRAGCQTRIWRTTCLDCHKPVWFFSCSCGSKVFFDAKGGSWLLHQDSCPIYHARLLLLQGSDPRTIRSLVEADARRTGIAITREMDDLLSGFGAPGKRVIFDILPSDDTVELEGTVYQINQINLFKRYGLDDNRIIRAIMDKLVSEPHLEITVRADDPGRSRTTNQWTFVIPESEIEGGLHTKMKVYASLQSVSLPNDEALWFATEIDWK